MGAPRMAPPGASTLSEDLSKVWEALENGDDIMGAPIGQTLVARAARSGKTFNSEDLQRPPSSGSRGTRRSTAASST